MHVYVHQLRDQLMMETSRLCISLHSIGVRMPELNYLKALVNMLIVIMLKFTEKKNRTKDSIETSKTNMLHMQENNCQFRRCVHH